jgi:hypothetical protein
MLPSCPAVPSACVQGYQLIRAGAHSAPSIVLVQQPSQPTEVAIGLSLTQLQEAEDCTAQNVPSQQPKAAACVPLAKTCFCLSTRVSWD